MAADDDVVAVYDGEPGELAADVFRANQPDRDHATSPCNFFALARHFHLADERRCDGMLGKKPHLQLVPPQHVADEHVVRSIIARFGGEPRHRTRFLQDNLVCM